MQSIGEQLEEARKRKGISLREAAEATKIRSDFLSQIEQGKMDFDLPEIYKRGFLKNYARYLKLDVEKVMTDYNAQQLSQSRAARKAGSEWFGQMDAKDDAKGDAREPATSEQTETRGSREGSAEAAPYGRIGASASSRRPEPAADAAPAHDLDTERARELHDADDESDKTFYLKIGLIFAGTLALVFVIFGLIWSILGAGDPGTEPQTPEFQTAGDSAAPAAAGSGGTAADQAPSDDSITLTASGSVYVLIRQQSDNSELLRKTFAAGESITVDKEGPVDVLFTAGENIVIEQGGERFRPNASGTAKITLQ